MKMKSTLLVFISLICFSCTTSVKKLSKTQKPNIIYILADDLGYGDLSCYGQKLLKTPNIDKLAAEGMLFTQHYSGSTVCAPSRSALLTGLHTGHTYIRGNKEVLPEGQQPLADSIITIPELLKKNGYVTGAFGKWGLGFPGSEGDPLNQGFDIFFGYNCQRLAHNYYPYYLWDNDKKLELDGNTGNLEEQYAPEVIQEQALLFLENNKDTSFFLYLPNPIPHAELKVPEKYLANFKGKFSPDEPYKGVDSGGKYRNGPYGSQNTPHAAFAGMIQLLDLQVGEIMDKVDELGIADNTIIIFTSDNGPHLEGGADPDFFDSNGKLKGYKRDLYEGGIRVPMIARWKGKINAGTTSDHISSFWDVMPTVADIVGFELNINTDGISFLPELLGENIQKNHEYLYWEFHEKGGRVAVRKGNWKGIRYNVKENPDQRLELYDLSVDIEEKENIAQKHPEIVNELDSIIEKAHIRSEIFQFVSETYLDEKTEN